jgi:DNA polymerase V
MVPVKSKCLTSKDADPRGHQVRAGGHHGHTDLRPTGRQAPLPSFENPHEERGIGTLLEDISRRYGRGSVGLGHAGIRGGPDWSMERTMLSPRYTTHWDELPLARAA